MSEASRQCIHEIKSLIYRWENESDLDEIDITNCMKDAVNEYFNENVIDFESDIDLEEDDE
jgi:hypothetical protein|tara:strand:+ start:455 stop:637 length:183 start_codon:yes stop_codon:yes gene_type:complete